LKAKARSLIMALCVLSLQVSVHAAPPLTAQSEIEYLLASVANSSCTFYRNGSWYDAKRAQEHLRLKYNYLTARKAIDSAEDFIEKAASRSSFSGRAYMIRCPGTVDTPSSQWLRDRLAEYRESLLTGLRKEIL